MNEFTEIKSFEERVEIIISNAISRFKDKNFITNDEIREIANEILSKIANINDESSKLELFEHDLFNSVGILIDERKQNQTIGDPVIQFFPEFDRFIELEKLRNKIFGEWSLRLGAQRFDGIKKRNNKMVSAVNDDIETPRGNTLSRSANIEMTTKQRELSIILQEELGMSESNANNAAVTYYINIHELLLGYHDVDDRIISILKKDIEQYKREKPPIFKKGEIVK